MTTGSLSEHQTPFRRYPPEMRERAVSMGSRADRRERRARGSGLEYPASSGSARSHCAIGRSGRTSTMASGTGVTTAEQRRLAELERENRL